VHRAVALTLVTVLLGSDTSADRASTLSGWYESVGAPLPGEGFGSFLGRVAGARVGAPYGYASETPEVETLTVEVGRFECVSFVESSLAVARCAWLQEPTQECFVWEVMGLRYRSGLMSDHASRLHYFADWLEDNAGRWRLKDLTAQLGGRPVHRDFFYLTRTRRGSGDPALASPSLRRAMVAIEESLSSRPHFVLGRSQVRDATGLLQDGDLVAVVGNKPGRLVTHAGFVLRSEGGRARLVHASSYHRRVVLTREDLADYLLRRPERTGVMVARPLPPSPPSTR